MVLVVLTLPGWFCAPGTPDDLSPTGWKVLAWSLVGLLLFLAGVAWRG